MPKKCKIEEHLDLDEINKILNETKDDYEIHRHLLLIKGVMNGDTIKHMSSVLNISRNTGERWIKKYNEKGKDGLKSDYSKCGSKSKLSDDDQNRLKEIIVNDDKKYTIQDVQKLIYDEFNIKFSLKHTWTITREKLGLNYDKHFLKQSEHYEDIEDNIFMYESRRRNIPNAQKELFESLKKKKFF